MRAGFYCGGGNRDETACDGGNKAVIADQIQEDHNVVDSGDPALKTRDQGDTNNSPAGVIERELDASYIPGVTDWQVRKQLIKRLLRNRP